MIIHEPEIFTHDDHTIVWAKIELKKYRDHFPDIVWYRVPNKYAEYVSVQSDAFLVPGLLAGMHFGEDIEVRGAISPRIAFHLDEFQFLLNFRMPKYVRPVDIKYSKIKPLNADPHGIGSSYSGGVDSHFTLWKHLPQNQPIHDYRVTHCLFVNGYDIRLNDENKYHDLFTRFQSALQSFNIELVPLETNIVSLIIQRLPYYLFYGPINIGCAHFFGGLFRRFFIPSSRDYYQAQIRESSSSPLTDSLLSTESLDIVHHGATHRRVEKIEVLRDWGLAQENLRVCLHSSIDGHYLNCSRCEKCIRTMIPLFALGSMDKFQTFSKPTKTNRGGLWWARKFDLVKNYVPEIIPFVRKHKQDLVPWLRIAAVLGFVRYWFLRLMPEFIKTWLRPYGFFVNPLKGEYAFDDPEIIRLIRSTKSSTSSRT